MVKGFEIFDNGNDTGLVETVESWFQTDDRSYEERVEGRQRERNGLDHFKKKHLTQTTRTRLTRPRRQTPEDSSFEAAAAKPKLHLKEPCTRQIEQRAPTVPAGTVSQPHKSHYHQALADNDPEKYAAFLLQQNGDDFAAAGRIVFLKKCEAANTLGLDHPRTRFIITVRSILTRWASGKRRGDYRPYRAKA